MSDKLLARAGLTSLAIFLVWAVVMALGSALAFPHALGAVKDSVLSRKRTIASLLSPDLTRTYLRFRRAARHSTAALHHKTAGTDRALSRPELDELTVALPHVNAGTDMVCSRPEKDESAPALLQVASCTDMSCARPEKDETPLFAPSALSVAGDVVARTMKGPRKNAPAIDVAYPVQIVPRSAHEYYVCNYRGLYLLDLNRCACREIGAPAGLRGFWEPTGLHYDPTTERLYVANYTGENVLILDASAKSRVKLLGVLSHPQLRSPEGVAVTAGGRYIAVADYDGSAVLLFDARGQLLWSYPVAFCHGVCTLRSPEGPWHVYATSLHENTVYKLNLDGACVAKAGGSGWQARGDYIYPTAIVGREDGLLAATDASRGQVSFINEDLSTVGCLGGNGPSAGMFNCPYACCWTADGQHLVVADTFKHRIVEVRIADRTITRIFRLTDLARRQVFFPGRFLEASDVAALAPRRGASGPALVNAEPFGKNLVANGLMHHDPNVTVTLPFPRFRESVRHRMDMEWHPGIQGLFSASEQRVGLWFQGMVGLFLDYAPRFVQAKSYSYEGQNYLLLTSPQSPEVLVCSRGIMIPVPLHDDTWLVGDSLVGPDYVISTHRLLRLAASRIEAILEEPAEGLPLDVIHRSIFPGLSPEDFRCRFVAAMTTPEGIMFARACLAASDAAGQYRSAERFFEESAFQTKFQLAEIALAEMILTHKQSPTLGGEAWHPEDAFFPLTSILPARLTLPYLHLP